MNSKSAHRVLAVMGLLVGLAAGRASAQNQFSSIVVFGDSLSDPGNLPKLLNINYPPPPYFENQFSNGPVYAKYLNDLFGIGAPLQDYAIGGAMTGVGNISGLPGNPSIGLPNSGIDGEITYYLSSHPTVAPHDLFIVWGGANNYLNVAPSLSGLGLSQAGLKSYLTGPQGPVTVAVGDLITDVSRLAAAGVKNFVVPNLPNLGATPLLNGKTDTAADGKLLTNVHNQQLAAALGQL
jgi:phospholipase/lecithinase/hemolysin